MCMPEAERGTAKLGKKSSGELEGLSTISRDGSRYGPGTKPDTDIETATDTDCHAHA